MGKNDIKNRIAFFAVIINIIQIFTTVYSTKESTFAKYGIVINIITTLISIAFIIYVLNIDKFNTKANRKIKVLQQANRDLFTENKELYKIVNSNSLKQQKTQ